MAKVECPFGGCDFTGSVGSTEAHISGSTSGEHQGEVGRNHREYLTQQAEQTIGTEQPPEQVASVARSGSTNPGRQVLLGTLLLAVVAIASTVPDEQEEIEVDQGRATGQGWVA